MNQPNIVILHSHDVGRTVQPYGYGVSTPHLQRFAENSVLFRQAFAAAPTCSPSRAAMLTGTCPHSNGMLGLAHLGFGLDDYCRHIVHTLKVAGYQTVLGGIQHEAPDTAMLGYDHVISAAPALTESDFNPSAQAKHLAPAVCEFLAEPHDRPFFLSVGFFDTHRPFPEPGADQRYVRPPYPIADTPETRRDMAGFATGARAMDEGFGRILDAIDQAGMAENTLVIVTTDHGPAFPGMKCTLTDHGLGVMLMLRLPGNVAAGRAIDAMITHMDLFPTICDVAGIARPGWLQGDSLLPLVHGHVDQVHEAIFGEVNFHAAYEPQRSVRTTRYKYIRRFGGRPHPVPSNCDSGLSKSLWLNNGWTASTVDGEQLYDLVFDPGESRNLAQGPSHADVLSEMQTRLLEWMEATADPLLDGPLYAPAGVYLSDADTINIEDGIRQYHERTRM